tara:strand:+ start:8988 stop:9380 length:393 start_codon:yes stop_codon:yes gene_type:complete
MTVKELKALIVWKDAEADRGESVGKTGDVYTDCNALLVRQSKTGAKRAVVIFENKKTKQTATVVCSLALTEYVRNGTIQVGHIKALPLFYSEDKGFFVGLGSQFIDFDEVKEEAFVIDRNIQTLEAEATL